MHETTGGRDELPRLDETFPADRVLSDAQRHAVQVAFWVVLSQPSRGSLSNQHRIDQVPDLVEEMEVIGDEESLHVHVVVDHGPHDVVLAVDEVERCGKHTVRDMAAGFDALASLGDEYADLETDLLEMAAWMGRLPADIRQWDHVSRDGFRAQRCVDGWVLFTLEVHPPRVVWELYRNRMVDVGEETGVPIAPPADQSTDEGPAG